MKGVEEAATLKILFLINLKKSAKVKNSKFTKLVETPQSLLILETISHR